MTKLYGVSCDSSFSQQAFREKLGVGIEQLSDFEPKGAVCKAFGVLHEGGFPERALVDRRPRRRRALELSGADRRASCPALKLLREGVGIAFGGGAICLTDGLARRRPSAKLRPFGY